MKIVLKASIAMGLMVLGVLLGVALNIQNEYKIYSTVSILCLLIFRVIDNKIK